MEGNRYDPAISPIVQQRALKGQIPKERYRSKSRYKRFFSGSGCAYKTLQPVEARLLRLAQMAGNPRMQRRSYANHFAACPASSARV